jgi:exopolysaccharide biosynthesis polyprenyl glycosylphosphotransferase
MTSLFGHSVRSELLGLYVAEALACFVAVYLLLSWQAGLSPTHASALAAAVALSCGLVSGASGLYRAETLVTLRRLLAATAVGGVLFAAMLPLLLVLDPEAQASLAAHLPGITLAFAGAVATTRLGFAALERSGALRRRIVTLRAPGSPVPDLARLAAAARPAGLEISANLVATDHLDELLDPRRLRAMGIWAVVAEDGLAVPPAFRAAAARSGLRVFSVAELAERQLARLDIENLPAGWLTRSSAATERPLEAGLRRAFDIVLSLLLLGATLPLLLLTAIAIRLESPGPVFYRQARVGRDNRVFDLLKFRSMVADAEAGGAPVWAQRRDPRVTRVGRIIRLTRIDEIPQVINVLRGEMAFVGPRPERPTFVEQLGRQIPHYHDRAAVKPGITGWAQVNYPYGASVEDARMKLAYDLYYVQRRSLFLDLLILVATVRVVLFQEGSR